MNSGVGVRMSPTRAGAWIETSKVGAAARIAAGKSFEEQRVGAS
jgi:hypothetical protein